MTGDWKRGVALLGRAGTGKTTTANALVRAGVCEARHSFAAALKEDLAQLGVFKDQPHAREMLIAYGLNRRAQQADYWIERLRHKLHDDLDGVVIDDARFPNEVAFLRSRGFLVVRLRAPRVWRVTHGIPPSFADSTDPSETACDDTVVDLEVRTDQHSPAECAARIAQAMQPVAA